MNFYQIKNPTTKQLFEVALNNDYITTDQLLPKVKQLYVLLKNHFNSNEVFITFTDVTNSGGYPIFFSENCSMYEIASNFNDDWYDLMEEERNEIVELYNSYTQDLKTYFNK